MKNVKSTIAKMAKKTAESALKRDANNTTCFAIFQPKPPANLSKFKNRQE